MKLAWEAPGAGDWWLVKEHFPYLREQDVLVAVPGGDHWLEGRRGTLWPADCEAQWAAVNGWIYYGPEIPLTSDELGARELTAVTTLTSSPWRDEVHRWH